LDAYITKEYESRVYMHVEGAWACIKEFDCWAIDTIDTMKVNMKVDEPLL
jgi:hypothetical protein